MQSILEHTNGIKDVLLLICFYLELLFVLVINSYCLPFRLVRSKRLLDQSCQMLLQDCSSDMLVIGRQDFFFFFFFKETLTILSNLMMFTASCIHVCMFQCLPALFNSYEELIKIWSLDRLSYANML